MYNITQQCSMWFKVKQSHVIGNDVMDQADISNADERVKLKKQVEYRITKIPEELKEEKEKSRRKREENDRSSPSQANKKP